jgi:hypothetical protein
MLQTDLFSLFTEPLAKAELCYMVSGSVASMVYGEPRLTNDIDLVLHMSRRDAPRLAAVFPLTEFYCPPEEVLAVEAARPQRGHFNLIHHATGHKADVYVSGADEFHAWALDRRRRIDMGDGRSLWVAPPEYVIVRKLEYFKEGGADKHRLDILGMLAVSGETIGSETVRHWAARCRVEKAWDAVLADSRSGT